MASSYAKHGPTAIKIIEVIVGVGDSSATEIILMRVTYEWTRKMHTDGLNPRLGCCHYAQPRNLSNDRVNKSLKLSRNPKSVIVNILPNEYVCRC